MKAARRKLPPSRRANERKGDMTTASPRRQSTPKAARLHQHPDGTIHALSGTDGRSVYVVTLGDTPRCTCPAGRNGRTCYHLRDAATRFPTFYTRPAAVIVPATEPEPPTPPAAPAFPVAGSYIPGKVFRIGGRISRRAA